MIELGTIGVLTLAIVELGKRKLPDYFTSDTNVLWSVFVASALSALNAFTFGGDWRKAVADGIITGLATAGAYKGVSSLSKRNSIDLNDVVEIPAQPEPKQKTSGFITH